MSAPTIPVLPVPSRVKARVLVEISVGSTSVLIDWSAARALLADLNLQVQSGELIRVTINCSVSGSKIVNFPLYLSEARSLIQTLDWFVND